MPAFMDLRGSVLGRCDTPGDRETALQHRSHPRYVQKKGNQPTCQLLHSVRVPGKEY